LHPPSVVFARGTSDIPAGSILSGMEEARLSGSGKENSATTLESNWDITYKPQRENIWNSQIDTEDTEDGCSGFLGIKMGGS